MFILDVNETPQILCDTPFYALPSFSRGSVVGQLQNYDPDNEQYHMSRRRNPRGPFEKRKQLLIYSFDNENITWPFHMTQTGIIYWKMVGCDSTSLNQFIDISVYLTLPYHTIPYYAIPSHTIPYHTIPYHTIPYHTIPYHTTIPCHAMPCHTIPYHTIPCHAMPCHAIPYHTILCHTIYTTPHHTIPYHT